MNSVFWRITCITSADLGGFLCSVQKNPACYQKYQSIKLVKEIQNYGFQAVYKQMLIFIKTLRKT